jgi:hypothetical protein
MTIGIFKFTATNCNKNERDKKANVQIFTHFDYFFNLQEKIAIDKLLW